MTKYTDPKTRARGSDPEDLRAKRYRLLIRKHGMTAAAWAKYGNEAMAYQEAVLAANYYFSMYPAERLIPITFGEDCYERVAARIKQRNEAA